MGGYAALAFAARHPRPPGRARARRHPGRRRQRRGARRPRGGASTSSGAPGPEAYLVAQPRPACSPPARRPRWWPTSAPAPRRAPPACVAGLEALRDRPDRSGELGAIACPTLVVCGEGDQVTPAAEMRRMADAIPGATLRHRSRAPATSPTSRRRARSSARWRRSSRSGVCARRRGRHEAGRDVLRPRAGGGPRRRRAAGRRGRRRSAVVLGSGLGGVADRLDGARSVPYASLPGFPETTVAGHPGRLVAGTIGGQDRAPAVRARARLRGLPAPARSASACGSSPRSACAR